MEGTTIHDVVRRLSGLTGELLAPQVCALTGAASGSALSREGRTWLPTLPERRCPRCDGPPGDDLECTLCRDADWHWVAAAALWDTPLKELVLRWKLRGDHTLTAALADVLCTVLSAEELEPGTCVVPIPPRGRTGLVSGGRMVIDLAWAVARRLGLPARLLLWARRPTHPQRRLRRVERLARTHHFTIRAALPANTRWILLIDDVMTTGATMTAAAATLRARWPGIEISGGVLARSWS